MPKNKLYAEISEPNLNVTLARLLRRRGLDSLGEVIIHSPGIKKPDILLTVNGVKVIIEGKFENPGAAARLEEQCRERIDDGLCEICVGVQYPPFEKKKLHVTDLDVEDYLLKSRFNAFVAWLSSPSIKDSGWDVMALDQLSDMVASSYNSVVNEDILGGAVQSLKTVLKKATEELVAGGQPEVLAAQIGKVLEIPEAPAEREEED